MILFNKRIARNLFRYQTKNLQTYIDESEQNVLYNTFSGKDCAFYFFNVWPNRTFDPFITRINMSNSDKKKKLKGLTTKREGHSLKILGEHVTSLALAPRKGNVGVEIRL